MYPILFFFNWLIFIFGTPGTAADINIHTLLEKRIDDVALEKETEQKSDEEKKEEAKKDTPKQSVQSYTLSDGRTVLRIGNGMNETQTIVQKDDSGNNDEIIKNLSAKSRPMTATPQPQIISGGDMLQAPYHKNGRFEPRPGGSIPNPDRPQIKPTHPVEVTPQIPSPQTSPQ